jgi:hypothetical protein
MKPFSNFFSKEQEPKVLFIIIKSQELPNSGSNFKTQDLIPDLARNLCTWFGQGTYRKEFAMLSLHTTAVCTVI